ncbi:hypothetical protein NDU88_001292 [Pleurodeles waltl]|uniref:Uncharacterized protein n=1 Tax=Pleurodeles waltl TaxID=8319 RepID=A0AAV7M4Y0_PLEWA|nr:hypothetical protein NDU88_001292 [Pleurodeles waltl]
MNQSQQNRHKLPQGRRPQSGPNNPEPQDLHQYQTGLLRRECGPMTPTVELEEKEKVHSLYQSPTARTTEPPRPELTAGNDQKTVNPPGHRRKESREAERASEIRLKSPEIQSKPRHPVPTIIPVRLKTCSKKRHSRGQEQRKQFPKTTKI